LHAERDERLTDTLCAASIQCVHASALRSGEALVTTTTEEIGGFRKERTTLAQFVVSSFVPRDRHQRIDLGERLSNRFEESFLVVEQPSVGAAYRKRLRNEQVQSRFVHLVQASTRPRAQHGFSISARNRRATLSPMFAVGASANHCPPTQYRRAALPRSPSILTIEHKTEAPTLSKRSSQSASSLSTCRRVKPARATAPAHCATDVERLRDVRCGLCTDVERLRDARCGLCTDARITAPPRTWGFPVLSAWPR
jgi:hypothetical protein